MECSDENQRHKRNDNILSWVFIFADKFPGRSLQLLLANYQYQIRITNNFILSCRIIGQYNTIVFQNHYAVALDIYTHESVGGSLYTIPITTDDPRLPDGVQVTTIGRVSHYSIHVWSKATTGKVMSNAIIIIQ